jgi:nicotinamidase-related amidase
MSTAFPSLFDPHDPFADMYPARIATFIEAGRNAGLPPAAEDAQPGRVALILVDEQYDFVHPSGSLSVPGAQADLDRLLRFLYRNIARVTTIYASLDTHHECQIFSDTWWQYAGTDERPAPFTVITLNDRGEAIDAARGRRVVPLFDPAWTLGTYLSQLRKHAHKDLMIWPYHCIEGTMGHNLMPALREALAFHSAARAAPVVFIRKGTCPSVEHYGIFAAEVPYPGDPSTGLNTAILDAIATHDLIYVAGQAKSHCVLETMKQLLAYFQDQPGIIRKFRFLMDCTSSVVHPQIDFDALAMAELIAMQEHGIRLVTSTDPVE